MNYISAAHLQEDLKRKLLENKELLFGVSLEPTATLFHYQDPYELSFKVFEIIKGLDLQVLHKIQNYPKTSQEIIRFIKEMKLYQIKSKDLPQDNPVEKDIYQMVIATEKLVEEPLELSQEKVLESGLTLAEKTYCRSQLFKLENRKVVKSKSYYYAQNKRQEMEAVIQDVIDKDLTEFSIFLPSKNEYLPLLESVLKRYGQDFSFEDRQVLVRKRQFISFLKFKHQPSHRNFIGLIKDNVFNLSQPEDYLTYLEHFEIKFTNLPAELNYAQDENHIIFTVQNRIQKDHKKIIAILKEIKHINYMEAFIFLYHFYLEKNYSGLHKFKDYIEEYQDFIFEDNHSMIIYHLENIQGKEIKHHNIQVYDYQEIPLATNDHVYFLGLSAKNFPNVQTKNGFIDENYYEKIAAFPSQQKRIEEQIREKERIFSLGKYQTYSYHIANYEGKALEASYNIIAHLQQEAQLFPLYQNKPEAHEDLQLDPHLSRELFFKQGILTASASSLQRYLTDPLAYFYEYGLKVKEEDKTDFNALVFGNLNHKIMETGNEEQVWDQIYRSYPKNSLLLKTIRQRNQESLVLNRKFLEEAQKHTSLETFAKEYQIQTSKIHPKMKLRGIVDRIDVDQDYFAIIDYKSSLHNLSMNDLEKGLQMQMLIYAIHIHKEYQKKALALMYYALRNPASLRKETYRYTSSKGILKNEDLDLWQEFVKNKRYSSWFFQEPSPFFEHADFWKGLRETKAGLVTYPQNRFNFQALSEFIYNRLDQIYQNISQGNFNLHFIEKNLELSQEEKEAWKEKLNS